MMLLILAACTGGPTEPIGQCAVNDAPTLDLAQGADWNLPDGVINFGIPPQGGAPYAPLEVRMVGVEFAEAYRIVMEADVEGEVFTTPPSVERFVCRNVGDEAGTRYAPEVHLRFFGAEPPEIDGKPVSITVEAFVNNEGATVSRTLTGVLDWTLGPMP